MRRFEVLDLAQRYVFKWSSNLLHQIRVFQNITRFFVKQLGISSSKKGSGVAEIRTQVSSPPGWKDASPNKYERICSQATPRPQLQFMVGYA